MLRFHQFFNSWLCMRSLRDSTKRGASILTCLLSFPKSVFCSIVPTWDYSVTNEPFPVLCCMWKRGNTIQIQTCRGFSIQAFKKCASHFLLLPAFVLSLAFGYSLNLCSGTVVSISSNPSGSEKKKLSFLLCFKRKSARYWNFLMYRTVFVCCDSNGSVCLTVQVPVNFATSIHCDSWLTDLDFSV